MSERSCLSFDPDLARLSSIYGKMRTLVIKVGSAVLTSPDGGVSGRVLSMIAREVAKQRSRGVSVVIVSSGAVAAGRKTLLLGRKPLSLAMKQAAASVGQNRLMWSWEKALSRHKITAAQVLLSPYDVIERDRFTHLDRTFETLLSLGIVPVVNENDSVATQEIRFGDNDQLSAKVAAIVRADFLLILSDVSALFTADPRIDSSAKRVAYVPAVTSDIRKMAGISRSGLGTGGMSSKVLAASDGGSWGLPVGIVGGMKPRILDRFFLGKEGTLFDAKSIPQSSKKVWIGYFSRPSGDLVLDAGAVEAIKRRKTSLLLPGIFRTEGDFSKGDVVCLRSMDGQLVGKGITRLSSMDIRGNMVSGGIIVVHVNDLSLLDDQNDQKELRPC
ncbi:MAG: glutamate 5-kinase [Leptospirillum sp.]